MEKRPRFGSLVDYVAWRGDLTFSQVPLGVVDALLLAVAAYQDFPEGGITLGEAAESLKPLREVSAEYQRLSLLRQMAGCPRYRDLVIQDPVSELDAERTIQFAAVTFLAHDGPAVIAYRGTDHTLVGWKEDFMMSYLSPVPAQARAVEYLAMEAGKTARPLVLTGHSKGGNLAAYAAAKTDSPGRLSLVCSFDGPGLDEETIRSEGYARIRPVLHSVIPNGSVVGLLMNYHPDYTVVHSTSVGLFQHDPFTWEILGPSFREVPDTTRPSQLMNETVHQWLQAAPPTEVRAFVEVLFTTLEKLYPKRGAEDLYDISLRGSAAAAQYVMGLEPETRERLLSLVQSLLTLGRDNTVDIMVTRPVREAREKGSASLKQFKEEISDD